MTQYVNVVLTNCGNELLLLCPLLNNKVHTSDKGMRDRKDFAIFHDDMTLMYEIFLKIAPTTIAATTKPS